jgi:hypothetical protein
VIVIVEGRFPVFDELLAVMIFVEVGPTESGAAGVIVGILFAGRHDPELATEWARDLAKVDELGDVRRALGFFELSNVLDDAGLACNAFELFERIKAGSLEIEVNEDHPTPSF